MYERHDKQLIVVFTGPNGAGRRTVAEMVGATLRMKQVLSYTTRTRRPNEQEGEDYWFVTPVEFFMAKERGEFIEVTDIDGNWYGIKEADIRTLLEEYGSVYLILNRFGADQLKATYGDLVKRVFIYADRETIIQRQKESGLSDELIARYLSHYDEEMAYRSECEQSYENLDLAHTVYDVTKVLDGSLERRLLELD